MLIKHFMYFPFLKVDRKTLNDLFHIGRQDCLRPLQVGHGAETLRVLVGIDLIPCLEVDEVELLVFGGGEEEVLAEEADGLWRESVLGVGPHRLCSG
jgi:hypothetical protein